METIHCDKCGQDYSDTYHKCPFCQEEEAARRGRPMYRRGKRLDQKQRSAGAFGVMKLVFLSVVLVVVGVVCFGDHVAGFLGIRSQEKPSTEQGDGQNPASSQTNQGENHGSPSQDDTSDDGAETPSADGENGAENGDGTEPAPLTIDQKTITIPSGQTARLTATGGNGDITWTSSNVAIATVENGSVTGVAGGTVTVTATAGEESVSCIVTVTGTAWVSDAKLSLNYTDFTLYDGDPSVQMKVKGTDSAVTWSSSDTSVATVSASGVVERVSKGTVTITAQVDGQTLTCIARMA